MVEYPHRFKVLFCVGSRWANVHMGAKTKSEYVPPPLPAGFEQLQAAELVRNQRGLSHGIDCRWQVTRCSQFSWTPLLFKSHVGAYRPASSSCLPHVCSYICTSISTFYYHWIIGAHSSVLVFGFKIFLRLISHK